jgi:hypothetical protein
VKRILKYPVPIEDEFDLTMRRGAKLLSVQTQGDKPFLWALVDQRAECCVRHFRVIGTGNPVKEEPLVYIGTFQMHNGGLVFHLFEVVDEPISSDEGGAYDR